jgi:hypothetical protein
MKHSFGVFTNDPADLFNRKQNAGFVVGQHHRNDPSFAAQCLAQIVEIEFATFVDLQPGYFATDLRQMFAEIADRFVFNPRGDDVTFIRILFEEATNRPVVRF